MITALMAVLVVLLVAGVVVMVTAAFRGCFMAQLWVCFGPMTTVIELIGALALAVVNAVTGRE